MLPAGVEPVLRQRVAAYAVVRSPCGLLATQFSDRTGVSGQWGMPGGGIDPGEDPEAAVIREVTEETSQTVQLGTLAVVQTSHWIGRSPHAVIEDFHAIRLVYRAGCAEPTEPVLQDVGGTTEAARWVPLASWAELAWTATWRALLGEVLGPEVS